MRDSDTSLGIPACQIDVSKAQDQASVRIFPFHHRGQLGRDIAGEDAGGIIRVPSPDDEVSKFGGINKLNRDRHLVRAGSIVDREQYQQSYS